MRRDAWLEALGERLERLHAWEDGWGTDASLPEPSEADRAALEALGERLDDNYPFFHPRYAGQMLKPPHPVAWVAYATAMAINPNNHALDGGPATAALEREAVAEIAAMFGLRAPLGHLSASGTVANLEALWVARCCRPGAAIAVSDAAHYTHARVAQVLGVEVVSVPSDAAGRMRVDALQRVLAEAEIGTVVATAGTTGVGALDPIDAIADACAAAGARLHVDAAYGGFFALLAQRSPPLVRPEVFGAIARADSVVVDPHKHGLQPYGCGCVLFADPAVGRFYQHDSPYTYFTSDELHLGEITLECSRAGASAAALWTTLRALSLKPHGRLGDSLAAGRRATLAWAERLATDPRWRLLLEPETDILVFAPVAPTSARASRLASSVFARCMEQRSAYLAKLRMSRSQAEPLWPDLAWDSDELVVLRSVVMKPEHEQLWPALHDAIGAALDDALAAAPQEEDP